MNNVSFPTISQAHHLFNSLFENPDSAIAAYPADIREGFCEHCLTVAYAAMAIAAKIYHLNSDKAYILGLLHDYGKHVDENNGSHFHGIRGYEDMLAMGYPELAQICLTHSFLLKEFNLKQYKYARSEMDQVKRLLEDMEYNDYDRLIQLCDLMVNNMRLINIKKRIRKISVFYGIPTRELKPFFRQALKLKQYFDTLSGCDIYQLLGIDRYES